MAVHSQPVIEPLARAGYAARGIVYLIVGGLAALAVLGRGGQTEGSRGALQTLLGEPLGKTLLVLIAVGLVGYSIWRLVQAIKDTDHHGTEAKGLAIRAGLLVSAVTHLLLAFYAVSLVWTLGGSQGGSGNGSQDATAWLLQQPYGRWLVGIVGASVVGAGIAHAIKGWKMKFERYLQVPATSQSWAYPVCRFGLVIRGAVLIIIGGFFLVAAWQADPSEAGGLGEVFNAVRQQVFGSILLGIVAVGLFAFGLYSLLEARYRRIDAPALG